jgi:hypothetical protein
MTRLVVAQLLTQTSFNPELSRCLLHQRVLGIRSSAGSLQQLAEAHWHHRIRRQVAMLN